MGLLAPGGRLSDGNQLFFDYPNDTGGRQDC